MKAKNKYRIATVVFLIATALSLQTRKKEVPYQPRIQLNKLQKLEYTETLKGPFKTIKANNNKILAYSNKQIALFSIPDRISISSQLNQVNTVNLEKDGDYNFEDIILMKDGTLQVLKRTFGMGNTAKIELYSNCLDKIGVIEDDNFFRDYFLHLHNFHLLELPGIDAFKAALWKPKSFSILLQNKSISHFSLSDIFSEKGVLDKFEIQGFIVSNNPKNRIVIMSVSFKEVDFTREEIIKDTIEPKSNFPKQTHFSLYFDQQLMKFRYTDMNIFQKIYKHKYRALRPGYAGFFGLEEEMLASVFINRQQAVDSKIMLSLFYYSNDLERYGHDISGTKALKYGSRQWLKYIAVGDLMPPVQFDLPERINTQTMKMTTIPFSTLMLVKFTSQTPEDITGFEVLRLIGFKSLSWKENPSKGQFNKMILGSVGSDNLVNILIKKDRMFSKIIPLDDSATSFLVKVENNQNSDAPLLYMTQRMENQRVPQFDCLANNHVLYGRRVCYKCQGYLGGNLCEICHPNLNEPTMGSCSGCLDIDREKNNNRNCQCGKEHCRVCTTQSQCISCNDNYALSLERIGYDNVCLRIGSPEYIKNRKKYKEQYIEEKGTTEYNENDKPIPKIDDNKSSSSSSSAVLQQQSGLTAIHMLLVVLIGLLVFSFATFVCTFMVFGVYFFNSERQKNQVLMSMLEQHLSSSSTKDQKQNSFDLDTPLNSDLSEGQISQRKPPLSLLEGVPTSQANSVYARTLLEGIYIDNETSRNSSDQQFNDVTNPRFTEASFGSQGLSHSDFSVLDRETSTRGIDNRVGGRINSRKSSNQRTQVLSIPENVNRRETIDNRRNTKMSRIFLNANEN